MSREFCKGDPRPHNTISFCTCEHKSELPRMFYHLSVLGRIAYVINKHV